MIIPTRDGCDVNVLMPMAVPLGEIYLQIALLPPISRGAHLAGPRLHADRLIALWKVPDDDVIPLPEAFRLLDAQAVQGAILRVTVMGERDNSPRYWVFPDIAELLPELRELAWQTMLAGAWLIEGIKGVRGVRHRTISPDELLRLVPDWDAARLTASGADAFTAVRIRRKPAVAARPTWRGINVAESTLKDAMLEIAQSFAPGEHPAFEKKVLPALRARFPDLPRDEGRRLLRDYAPQLRGQRGRH
jgi:hypothetical protein